MHARTHARTHLHAGAYARTHAQEVRSGTTERRKAHRTKALPPVLNWPHADDAHTHAALARSLTHAR